MALPSELPWGLPSAAPARLILNSEWMYYYMWIFFFFFFFFFLFLFFFSFSFFFFPTAYFPKKKNVGRS